MRNVLPSLLLTAFCLASPFTASGQSGGTPVADTEPDLGKADNIPIAKVPDVEPASKDEMMENINKAVTFLLENQHENGSWGDHTGSGTWSVLAPYPSGPRTFRTASTALCIMALEVSPLKDDPKVQEAMVKAEDFLLEEMPKLKRGDTITFYNVWAHAYAMEAFCMRSVYLDKDSERYKKFYDCANLQMKRLNELADVQGGWGYYDFDDLTKRPSGMPTSFLTGAVLVAIKKAQDTFGIQPDQKVLSRAIRFLKNQRTPAGTYVYSLPHQFVPTRLINRHTGSLARTPACDYSLKLFEPDYLSMRQLLDAIEKFWSRIGWLNMSLKKPKPHESFAQNSGYFVFYGYYYIALCVENMLPEYTKKRQASLMVYHLRALQEKDGSWWDFPLYNYHKYYGTGYALFSFCKAWDVLYGNDEKHLGFQAF